MAWIILGYLMYVTAAHADEGTYIGKYVCNPKEDKLTFSNELLMNEAADAFRTINTNLKVVYSSDDLHNDNGSINKTCRLSSGMYKVILSYGYEMHGGWTWPEMHLYKGKEQIFYTERYEFIDKCQVIELDGKTGKVQVVSQGKEHEC